jgi:methionine synthase I (cobalamin-dependent)
MTALLDVLRSGRVLLMDGAMGTELQKVGLKPNENAAAWNFLHPYKVQVVHQAYLDAGAEVFLTNTFLINCRSYMATVWRAHQVQGFRVAWRRAYDLVGPEAAVRLASVGPVAGDPSPREFDEIRRFWVSDECDDPVSHDCVHFPHGILLETCSSPRVRYALARLRGSKRPLLLSLAFQRATGGRLVTFSGHSPEWFARRAKAYGADALGVNCGKDVGMDEMLEIIRRYRQETDLPLFARPNAGTPRRRGGRWVYPQTPQEMADRLPELLEAGVCMVGGCCGTTPEHIAAFRKVVDAWNARHVAAVQQAR